MLDCVLYRTDGLPDPTLAARPQLQCKVAISSLSAITVGHEVAHATDCALDGGVYHSSFDPKIRSALRVRVRVRVRVRTHVLTR